LLDVTMVPAQMVEKNRDGSTAEVDDSSTAVGRNIILLSDGTGNSAGKLFKTNVWRVYDALDLSNAGQIASYDDGVGTSSVKPLAVLGGAFGWGLKRNVLALYTFLCRNYRPGDQIYAFGFSRGAFTIRVLISFVLAQGLIADATSSGDLQRKALRLYRVFRADRTKGYGLHTLARPLRDILVAISDGIFGGKRLRNIATTEVPEIKFLGLWDTVDAYGLPIEELKTGVDRWIWPLSLDDKTLHPKIRKACHALSIDDKRTTFHPLLWDESGITPVDHTDDEALTQVWFAGMHANVGGGYPDDGLSYVPLRWMINEARKKGLRFNSHAVAALGVKLAPYGRIYDSRAGLGAYYRFGPRRLDPPRDRQDACIPQPKIHETVLWRMAVGSDAYAPLSVPNELLVVTDDYVEQDNNSISGAPGFLPRDDGARQQEPNNSERSTAQNSQGRRPNILKFDEYRAAVQSGGHLFGLPAGPDADLKKRQRVAAEIGALTMPDSATLELLWDTAWWRRIAFFTTLISTGLLLSCPVYLVSAEPSKLDTIKRIAAFASALLPAIAEPWIDSFRAHPGIVSGLAATTALFVAWGKFIDRTIHDRALASWNPKWRSNLFQSFRDSIRQRYAMAVLLTVMVVAPLAAVASVLIYFAASPPFDFISFFLLTSLALIVLLPAMPIIAWWFVLRRISRRGDAEQREIRGFALWLAYRLRSSKVFVGLYRLVARGVLPTGFACALVLATLYAASRLSFDVLDSRGWVCNNPSSALELVSSKTIDFKTSEVCQASQVRLEAKVKYRIEITPENWKDGDDVPVSPEGATTWSMGLYKWPLLPLRRRLTTRWFVPLARIGETGNEEYVLAEGATEITPARNGALYLYVNEAVIGLPYIYGYFYRDNSGTAKITITPIDAPRQRPIGSARVDVGQTAPAVR
jgi:uncharacterized protein (DUF2235 family)